MTSTDIRQVAANRGDLLSDALKKTWNRGGVRGFYQGLIPWVCLEVPSNVDNIRQLITEKQAWIEASTKGSILILTSTEVEHYSKRYLGVGNSWAGVLGGVAGGAAQAYLTMGKQYEFL